MKFAKVALIMAVDGRIHVNFGPPTQSGEYFLNERIETNSSLRSARPAPVTADRELGGGKFTKELASESVTMAGEFDDDGGEYEEFDACCEMIESHVFGQKRAFKRMDQAGRRPIWVSNDDHQIQFNELLQMWQVVNSTTINPVGEAFSHGRNAADDCPTETEWTVRNLDSWLSVKNFVQCQGENDDDKQAFKLSYTVCDLIQETEGKNLGDRMRNSLQKRKNTLCNRAMNHARVRSQVWAFFRAGPRLVTCHFQNPPFGINMARHFTRRWWWKGMKHTEFTTFMLLDIAPCSAALCHSRFFYIKVNLEMKLYFFHFITTSPILSKFVTKRYNLARHSPTQMYKVNWCGAHGTFDEDNLCGGHGQAVAWFVEEYKWRA